MRTFCKVLAVCSLVSMSGICVAQNADPFDARAADDPFSKSPFAKDKTKPKVAPKPGAQIQSQRSAAPPNVADPFAGGAAADPFAAGPTAGDKAKPRVAAKAGAQAQSLRRAAQPKNIPGRVGKVIPDDGPSETSLRIRAALSDETTQTFVNYPLEDAIQTISKTHSIPIVVDRRALEEFGLTPDVPVNLDLKNVSLRSFLRLMLRELDLTYMVKDEVLQITTVEAAEMNLVLEMYRFPAELTEKSDKIVAALTKSVVPAAWAELGGPCSVSVIDNVLVVSATENIHEDVLAFLQKLQAAFEKHEAAN